MTIRLVVGFLLLAAAGTALAAPARKGLNQKSAPQDVRMLHDFSRCLAERRRDEARGVLAMDFRTGAYDKALRRLAGRHHGCAPNGRLRFHRLLFAGGLAEALLEADLAATELAEAVAFGPSTPPIEARDQIEAMSLCTVRKATPAVAALLAATPASDAEREAANLVSAHLVPCLASGQSARFNRPALRSLLALAAYRLSRTGLPPRPPSGS